jgi:hypothetical protein
MYPISRSTRANATQRTSEAPETPETAIPAPARSLTRSMAGLSVRDAPPRSCGAAPMAPRAALKKPDARDAAGPAQADRRVAFDKVARAKPADGADSFVTQVKFEERPGRHRGTQASSSSQPRPTTMASPSRTSPADAGPSSASGKSGGNLLGRLFGAGRRKDADSPATPTNAAIHASTPGPRPPVAKFNGLVKEFMEADTNPGQKQRLFDAVARGPEGVRQFLLSGEINRTADANAARILMDAATAFHKVGPHDRLELPRHGFGGGRPEAGASATRAQAATPSRRSNPGALTPVAKFNDLVMDFMKSGAEPAQKKRLSDALGRGPEAIRRFLATEDLNSMVDPEAGRLLMAAVGAFRKLTPADQFEIRVVAVKPQGPTLR